MELAWDKHNRRIAYESKPVCIGVLLDIFRQVSTGHPIRNELERSDSDA